MADNHDPLPGAQLGRINHPNELIPRNNVWHISKHSLGGASNKSNHLSYDNQIHEVRHTLFWRRETGIFKKRGRHPLHSVRVYHGTLSGQSVSRKNHDHRTMGEQRLHAVYQHPGQWPQQGHQYPCYKQARFLQNTRNRSCLTHTRTRRHRTTNSEPTHTSTIIYNFFPIATRIKWSLRK